MFPPSRSVTRLRDPSTDITNLRFSFPVLAHAIEICLANYAASLAAFADISLFSLRKPFLRPGRLPRILRNKIMFLISTCYIWFEFHLQISRCRFSPSDAIFLPNSGKFPPLCRVTRIFRVEITSRSPLYLERYKLFHDSHLNLSQASAVLFTHCT